MFTRTIQITFFIICWTLCTAFACTKKAISTTTTRTSLTHTVPEPTNPVKPKNIILLIGDGMGITQISAGLYMNNNHLELERMPVIGLHKSYSADQLITDSAAGATAFSTGIKTYNGAIGISPDSMPQHTLLESAKDHHMATGMLVTSTIVHATPASFIAHVDSRKKYEEIATYFIDSDIDFFIGGGKKFFDRRDDGMNIIDTLRNKGYTIDDYFTTDWDDLEIPSGVPFGYFTADEDPLMASNGRNYLMEAGILGIDHLDNMDKNGFFFMVEGSQIDWGGHANDSDYIITEMIDFDKTLGKILDWAEQDGETLVVVTADHETGGYSIISGSEMGKLETAFTTTYHTADLIPVFAYGPGAENFAGIYENTAIFQKIKAIMGW